MSKTHSNAPTTVGNEMRNAWITGVAAAISVVLIALMFNNINALTEGLNLFGWQLSDNKHSTAVTALLLVAASVFIVDALRLFAFEKAKTIQIHADIRRKQFRKFGAHCLISYIEALVTLWLIIFFYKTAGEYGYERQAEFYQVWFRFLDSIWNIVIIAGLPYIVLSSALTESTTKENPRLFALLSLLAKIVLRRQHQIDSAEKIAALAQLRCLILRLIFLPLAAVLFSQHFVVLVQSIDQIGSRIASSSTAADYTHAAFNRDFVKTSMALILCIIAALASCGYMLSSRWLNNHFRSVDPSLLGWTVCLLNFPPFTLAVTWFFKGPMEHGFLSLDSQILISFLALIFVGAFTISLCASLCFGSRYANLSHRGIICNGPYAWVRHPDYAAMNIAWWCTGIPFILLIMNKNGFAAGATLFIGLCLNSVVYYLRAITEEKHLLRDPDYENYCKKVKYRFIPGLI